MDIEKQIIKDISKSDYYKDCGYDCWKHFLSDANMNIDKEKYDEVLYEDFTEEELDKLWWNYHK